MEYTYLTDFDSRKDNFARKFVCILQVANSYEFVQMTYT